MEEFEQKMQQWRKEDHERKQKWKQEFDELCKKEREIDEKILTSISKLVQSIQEFKEASDSSVAPQMFDEKSEQKPEPTDFSLQSSDVASSVAPQVFNKKSEIVTLVEVLEENVELEDAYVQGIVEDVEKQHYLKEPFKFTVFLLQIQWTVSVPKPFEVH